MNFFLYLSGKWFRPIELRSFRPKLATIACTDKVAIKAALLGCLLILGCSSHPPAVIVQKQSTPPASQQLEDYPRTYLQALPDQPGFCVAVTEAWVERTEDGKSVWLKEKSVQSANCSRTQWDRLSDNR